MEDQQGRKNPGADGEKNLYTMDQIEEHLRTKHRQDVGYLISLLKSPYQLDREKSSDYLGEIGDPEAVPALIEALADPTISWLAAESLGKIGDPRAVEPLIGVLSSPEKWLRRNAAEALGKIGDTRAVVSLLPLLQDKKHDVREITSRALGILGDTTAVPALEALQNDPDPKVREAAARSVRQIREHQEPIPAGQG